NFLPVNLNADCAQVLHREDRMDVLLHQTRLAGAEDPHHADFFLDHRWSPRPGLGKVAPDTTTSKETLRFILACSLGSAAGSGRAVAAGSGFRATGSTPADERMSLTFSTRLRASVWFDSSSPVGSVRPVS